VSPGASRDPSARPWRRAKGALPAAPPGAVRLSTWLASRDQVDWLLEPSGVRRLPEGAGGPLVAFHPELLRIPSSPCSTRAARSAVLRAGYFQERVRVVNRSREDGALHAAPVRVLDSLARSFPGTERVGAIVPGLLLADRLRRGHGGAKAFAGAQALLLDLGAPEEPVPARRERLVIAIVYREDGASPATTCSLTVEPIDSVARLVLYEHRAPPGTPWTVLGPGHVLAAAVDLPGWPLEPHWAGLPVRHLARVALLASALLALASGVRLATTLWSLAGVERDLALRQARAVDLEHQLAGHLLAHPQTFARLAGLEPGTDLDRARALWRVGTRVSVDADLQRSELTVALPLVRPATASAGRPARPPSIPPERLDALFPLEVPPGCQPAQPRTRGALDEISMVVVCPRPDPGLSALLPR